ncbi:MAG: hypothetical protein WBA13_21000 [Microcoleaceae cyanobacterium]
MKHIILVLGLIASTGLTVAQVDKEIASSSQSSPNQSYNELQISLNYEGTNEDGDREGIDTGRS